MKLKIQEIPVLEPAQELRSNAEDLNISETIYHPAFLIGLLHHPPLAQEIRDASLRNDFKEIFQLLKEGNLKLIKNGNELSFLKFEKTSNLLNKDFNLPYYNLDSINLYAIVNQKNELLQSVSRKLCKEIKKEKLTNKPLVKVFFSKQEAENYLRSLISYDLYNTTNRPLKVVNLDLQTAYSMWQNCESNIALIPSSRGLGKTIYFTDQKLTLQNGKVVNLISFEKETLLKTLKSFGKTEFKIQTKKFNHFLMDSKYESENYFFLPLAKTNQESKSNGFDYNPEKKFSPFFKFRNILLVNPLSYHTKSQLINKENNLPSSFAEEEYEKLLSKEKTRNRKRKKRAHRRQLYRMYRWCFQKLYYWSMEENQKTAANSKNSLVQQLVNRTKWRTYEKGDVLTRWDKMRTRTSKIITFDPIRERKEFFFKRPATLLEYLGQKVIWNRKDGVAPITQFAPLNWRMRSLFNSPDNNVVCSTPEIKRVEAFVDEFNNQELKSTIQVNNLKQISKNTSILKK